ncbi:DUF4232 domain-containing protein [Kitasatospora sp. NPDC094015]|uniref:DUF4232 domain-containing protein n=1 Tax=Kitasatospora sp. NPDC094015 TaxID=3155205 RepID=UPI0033319D91
MKIRHLTTATALACGVLTLAACGPTGTPAAAPATPAAGTAASTAAGNAPAAASGSPQPGGKPSSTIVAEAPACGGSERESDITGELTELDRSAAPRWSGLIKLTNTSAHACKLYGPADVRTDGANGSFTKLATGVLGNVKFVTDKAHATVVMPGESLYQAVSWFSSPPTAPNASCTTGSLLVLARNEETLFVTIPVKDARFCPVTDIDSPQILIGAQLAVQAQARAQLQALTTK